MSKLKPKTDWLRAGARGMPLATDGKPGVDRNAQVIRCMIVAQVGPFKTEGRGEFNQKGLRGILKLMKAAPSGLKSRFTHPDSSIDGSSLTATGGRQVHPHHFDFPLRGALVPLDGAQERTFARAARSDDRDPFTPLDVQFVDRQHRRVAAVPNFEVFDLDHQNRLRGSPRHGLPPSASCPTDSFEGRAKTCGL